MENLIGSVVIEILSLGQNNLSTLDYRIKSFSTTNVNVVVSFTLRTFIIVS